MNLKTLLSIYAIILALSGVGTLVLPSRMLDLYGAPPLNPLETGLAQLIGAVTLGLAVMCWTARTAEASKARDALILGLITMHGFGTMVVVLMALSLEANWLIWAHVGFFALFTVLFIVTGRRAMSAPAGGAASS